MLFFGHFGHFGHVAHLCLVAKITADDGRKLKQVETGEKMIHETERRKERGEGGYKSY